MKEIYVTITGKRGFFKQAPYKVGRILRLRHEPDNIHDSFAICAELPLIGTIGYVANHGDNVYEGTLSAREIYYTFDECAYAKIRFITRSSVIAQIIEADDETERIFSAVDSYYEKE